jgi:hypothetical protein
MSPFVDYEKAVLQALLGPHMSPTQIHNLVDSASMVSCEHTEVGYFLTVQHPALPSARLVCSEPSAIGLFEDVNCGFVIFIENGQLTLECHSWGDAAIPEDIRDRQMGTDASR